MAGKLVRKGLRRSGAFFDGPPSCKRYFNLLEPGALFMSLDGTEAQIAYLRSVAKDCFSNHENLIIRYYHDDYNEMAQYTTVFPCQGKSKKGKHSSLENTETWLHRRWLLNTSSANVPPVKIKFSANEEVIWRKADDFLSMADNTFQVPIAPGVWSRYSLLMGDGRAAAIFNVDVSEPETISRSPHADFRWGHPISVEHLNMYLRSGVFSQSDLLHQVEPSLSPSGTAFTTLKALSVISVVYKLLPDATIAMGTLDRPIHQTHWTQSMYHTPLGVAGLNRKVFEPGFLCRSIALSCVAYLESGYCDIVPSQLKDVIALSTGDSIYVAMPVSCILAS